MIRRAFVLVADELNPYKNIALEALLLELVPADTCVFYLWQNRHTVVIGRNQNAWKECRVDALESDGGFLARRLSGGGAVFHDRGNLNFTFVLPKSDYDLAKQTDVILRAVRNAGIDAQKSGRNDIETDGRKFSGNAFYQSGKNSYHHGTLLVNADLNAASAYLSVSPDKIKAKGVESVRRRIINLTECVPSLTVAHLKELLAEAFADVYGISCTPLSIDTLGELLPNGADAQNILPRLNALEAQFSSPEWKYGKNPAFEFETSARFPWGGVEVRFSVTKNLITDVYVFSDAMDETFILELPAALRGTPFLYREISGALMRHFADNPERQAFAADIAALIKGES